MKTPNSREINQFTGGRIIGQSESGVSNRQIGRNLTLKYQTVNNIVNKWKSEGHCRVERRSGRQSETSEREKRAMKREIDVLPTLR